MALNLYTGTPGSGKSLHLVRAIIEALSSGKDVIANFGIIFNKKDIEKSLDKHFYYIAPADFSVNTLLEHAIDHDYIEKKKESQCLVIYDEAGGKYNSRNVGAADRSEWIDFFSQHRKIGFDIILSCQGEKMIDRQIRTCIETEFVHRKVNNYGLFFLLPFSLFVAIERWYVAKERVGSSFFRYKKKFGERYDTMKMFEGFKMSPELLKKIEDKKKMKESKDTITLTENVEVSNVLSYLAQEQSVRSNLNISVNKDGTVKIGKNFTMYGKKVKLWHVDENETLILLPAGYQCFTEAIYTLHRKQGVEYSLFYVGSRLLYSNDFGYRYDVGFEYNGNDGSVNYICCYIDSPEEIDIDAIAFQADKVNVSETPIGQLFNIADNEKNESSE